MAWACHVGGLRKRSWAVADVHGRLVFSSSFLLSCMDRITEPVFPDTTCYSNSGVRFCVTKTQTRWKMLDEMHAEIQLQRKHGLDWQHIFMSQWVHTIWRLPFLCVYFMSYRIQG